MFIVFSAIGPSIRLADFGCAGMMRRDTGLTTTRGARAEAPEEKVALAAERDVDRPLCLGAKYDVWCAGRRIFPRLLPGDVCSGSDSTWAASARPLLDSCVADVPDHRPTPQQLSCFFSCVAQGLTAALALADTAVRHLP